MLPICCAIVFLLKLSGPIHTVFTVTGMSMDGLNSTVQVIVTVVALGRTVIEVWSLVTLTEVGAGTKINVTYHYSHHASCNRNTYFEQTQCECYWYASLLNSVR